MKKTILTVAACMLMVTGLMAKTRTSNDYLISTTLIAKSEISSFCKTIMASLEKWEKMFISPENG